MKLGEDVFSTGQIAKIFAVASRTVSKWFDSGAMPGFTITGGGGGGDRRVLLRDLIAFADANGMGVVIRKALFKSLLLVGVPPVLCGVLAERAHGWNVLRAGSLFEAGAVSATCNCGVVVLDCATVGRWAALSAVRAAPVPGWGWVALLAEDDEQGHEAFLEAGCLAAVRGPADPEEVLAAVARWCRPGGEARRVPWKQGRSKRQVYCSGAFPDEATGIRGVVG